MPGICSICGVNAIIETFKTLCWLLITMAPKLLIWLFNKDSALIRLFHPKTEQCEQWPFSMATKKLKAQRVKSWVESSAVIRQRTILFCHVT